MSDRDRLRIGFIGVGAMGGGMARSVRRGHPGPMTVYDVDRVAVERMVEAGASAAATPKEVGAASDIVVMMLPHPSILASVVEGPDGLAQSMRQGAVLIDMSTNGPAAVRRVGETMMKHGVRMIDAPVGKGPAAAEKGDLTIMVGGDRDLVDAHDWLLRLMGSKLYYCGPLGTGQVTKLANNLASCATMAVVAEAYALAQRGGADLSVFAEVMANTSADSWHVRHTLIGKILKGDFEPIFKLRLALKDMRIIEEMTAELSSPSAITAGALDWYEKGDEAGHGDLDWGAIILASNPELKPGQSGEAA